jgi:hypothetical protein
MNAQHLLDAVQSLPRAEQFEPSAYLAALRGELGETLEEQDEALRRSLVEIDELCARVMRLRLDHVLANDPSIAAPTRKVFATTITSYAGQVPTLIDRAREIASRTTRDADAVANRVGEAADAALALREELRHGVLALVKELAIAHVPVADHNARDRSLDDATRRRWSSARRELEAVAARPERIASAPFTTRTAPAELDEPDPEPESTFADMIELD